MGRDSRTSASHNRRNDYPGPKKKKKSFGKLFFIFTLLFLIIIAGLGFGFVGATMQDLPNVDDVKPAASSQIYDVHGDLITTVHAAENRLPVKLSDTPKVLQDAFISAEDSRFYSHYGIDPRGIIRAAWVNLTHQGVAEGGSTITQQLARNAFLTQDQTLKRKVKEALLAIKIEQNYTKAEILEMYMNQIYFGQGSYGVETAARTYFGKDAKDLTLAQSALLAGLPNSPNYLNPFNNLEGAKARQVTILDQMVKYGYITEAQAREAKNSDIELASKPTNNAHTNSPASYFVDYVLQTVSTKYGDDAVYKGGLKIYTTIDMAAQKAAVAAMENLPTFYTDNNGLAEPQGALVAINPRNGYIVAMVGGRGTDYFNRATQATRQPGSSFKPFVYLTAIQQGMTPGTIVDDSKVTYAGWTPQNYERNYNGRITLRYALMHSVNVATVKIADQVGMSKVIETAKNMGITTLVTDGSHSDVNLAAAIGGLTAGVTPIEMASAYGVLADGGVRVAPVAITKIVDRSGQILEENSLEEKRVIDAKDAYILTNMLESVIKSGTGGNASIGRPAAGKTGTTDDTKDAWFVGYTPDLATAVWIGDDNGSETLQGMTGGTLPAEIWRQFMSTALEHTAVSDFTVPDGARSIAAEGFAPPVKAETKKEPAKNEKEKPGTKQDDSSKGTDATQAGDSSGADKGSAKTNESSGTSAKE